MKHSGPKVLESISIPIVPIAHFRLSQCGACRDAVYVQREASSVFAMKGQRIATAGPKRLKHRSALFEQTGMRPLGWSNFSTIDYLIHSM